MGSVEGKRTVRSARLTGNVSVPPAMRDLPDNTSEPLATGASFAVPESVPEAGEGAFLLCAGARPLSSLEFPVTRSGNRLAYPNPSAIMFNRALSTGRLVIRVKMRPSFQRCCLITTRYGSLPSRTIPEKLPPGSSIAQGGRPQGVL